LPIAATRLAQTAPTEPLSQQVLKLRSLVDGEQQKLNIDLRSASLHDLAELCLGYAAELDDDPLGNFPRVWENCAVFIFEVEEVPLDPGVSFVDLVEPRDVLVFME
jgi:hypothetical protein